MLRYMLEQSLKQSRDNQRSIIVENVGVKRIHYWIGHREGEERVGAGAKEDPEGMPCL